MQGYVARAHVSTAKHGVWGLTKALAREFGPKGVTVNAISPGPIESERIRRPGTPQSAAWFARPARTAGDAAGGREPLRWLAPRRAASCPAR